LLNVEISYGGLSILDKGHALLRGEALFRYRPAPARRATRLKARRGKDLGATVTANKSSRFGSLKKLRLSIKSQPI
jgi:hypothetical protein